MKPRKGPVPRYILIAICLISVLFVYIELTWKVKSYAPFYEAKRETAFLAQGLFAKIKEAKLNKGLTINELNDPNKTGLIGLWDSPITTGGGDLTAKMTAANPNFAAIIIELLKEAGLKEHDTVAVSFSSSFPALNIIMLAAIETLKLRPVIITNVSSSMWGANEPEFTYLDMERSLFEAGMITYRTSHASIGGIDDVGRGLRPEGRDMILNAISRNGLPDIKANGLKEAISKRMEIYKEQAGGKKIRAFINVGGGAAVLAGVDINSGIVDRTRFARHKGLAGEYLRSGIPVINITNIKHLARQYGLPIAPIPQPEIGEGRLFYEMRYSVALSSIFTIILFLMLLATTKIDLDYYLKAVVKRPKKP